MKEFLTALQAGIILFAMAVSGSGWASDNVGQPGAKTGSNFANDILDPRADDLAPIRCNMPLYLASLNAGLVTAGYSPENERIV